MINRRACMYVCMCIWVGVRFMYPCNVALFKLVDVKLWTSCGKFWGWHWEKRFIYKCIYRYCNTIIIFDFEFYLPFCYWICTSKVFESQLKQNQLICWCYLWSFNTLLHKLYILNFLLIMLSEFPKNETVMFQKVFIFNWNVNTKISYFSCSHWFYQCKSSMFDKNRAFSKSRFAYSI